MRWKWAVGTGIAVGLVIAGAMTSSPEGHLDAAPAAVEDGVCLVRMWGAGIQVVRFDGRGNGRVRWMRQAPERPFAASWSRMSPDGNHIVAVASISAGEPMMAALTIDGSELWRLPTGTTAGVPEVSQDGRFVAFAANRRLGIFERSWSAPRWLPVSGIRPAWSPDGTRLAFEDEAVTFVFDLRRGEARRIGFGGEPSWTSDGHALAMRTSRDEVVLHDLRTADRRRLLSAPDISVPRWSPNGRWMMYSRRARVIRSLLKTRALRPLMLLLIDGFELIVRDSRTGEEFVVGGFAKNSENDFTWVANAALCSTVARD